MLLVFNEQSKNFVEQSFFLTDMCKGGQEVLNFYRNGNFVIMFKR